jgi:hypothetical protein
LKNSVQVDGAGATPLLGAAFKPTLSCVNVSDQKFSQVDEIGFEPITIWNSYLFVSFIRGGRFLVQVEEAV